MQSQNNLNKMEIIVVKNKKKTTFNHKTISTKWRLL